MVKAVQFDVCRVQLPGGEIAVHFAVILQHDALSDLATRVVAPLIPVDEPYQMDRATPMIDMQGERYAVAVHLLTTLPVRALGRPVANLRDQESVLKRAIDTTFLGI